MTNDWHLSLLRPTVAVIASAPTELRPDRVVAADGGEREVDTIIFGTGFATNDFLAPMTIRGRWGQDLHELWRERGGAEAYLGVTVSGFPNLFILYGPNTNLGHNSIIYMLESQSDYVLEAIQYARSRGATWIDVHPQAQEEYNRELQQRLKGTAWQPACVTWTVTEHSTH